MLFLAAIPLLLLAWFAGYPRWREQRRSRLRARPFPAEWRAIIRRRVPIVRKLPFHLRRQLEGHIQVFLDEKDFVGCAEQEIDDEVRLTIAAQACLLLLNRKAHYFPLLRKILVYPGPFVVERLRLEPSGVLQETRHAPGEVDPRPVVLSWEDAANGAAIPDDGSNVVIHEFAHQLDQEGLRTARRPWARAAATSAGRR